MDFSLFSEAKIQEAVGLFRSVFSASEGAEEGQVIANFVSELITTTKAQDLIGFVAQDNGVIVGAIFFSRFIVPNGQRAFILSPVAVATDVQGKGVGQQLIRYGLDQLSKLDVELVFTYGDPAYYSKTDFEQITEHTVKAPCSLSQPIGWLAQALDGSPVPEMHGATRCVDALNDPQLW